MDASLDTWFKREILVHEASLLRYLRRVWPKQDEVHDLRQEIYVRIYESACKTRPLAPRAFIFATARNLITDRIRRGRVVSIEAVGDTDALNLIVDEISPERRLNAWQELKRVAGALNGLPPRCREVVWLTKVHDLSAQEVADRLGMSPRTVETHIRRGMQLLNDAVYGGDGSPQRTADLIDSEAGHGEH